MNQDALLELLVHGRSQMFSLVPLYMTCPIESVWRMHLCISTSPVSHPDNQIPLKRRLGEVLIAGTPCWMDVAVSTNYLGCLRERTTCFARLFCD